MRAKFISNERRAILNRDAEDKRGHHPKVAKAFWKKFLSAKEDTLTEDDWIFAQDLAAEWRTCACGSLDEGISRHPKSLCPLDDELSSLGLEFLRVVNWEQLAKAQKLFKQINDRAAVVLWEARK